MNANIFTIDSNGIIAGDGSGLTGIATAFSAGGLESLGSGSVIDFDGTNWRTSSGGWSLSGGSTILGGDGSASFADGAVTIGSDGSFDAISANGMNGELFLGNGPFIYLPSQIGMASSLIGGVSFNPSPATGSPIDLNGDGSASFAYGNAFIEAGSGAASFGDITSNGGILNLRTTTNHIAADGSLAIDTPAGTSMFFGADGKIGIGAASTNYQLTVVGDDGSGNVASFRTGSGSTACTLNSSTGLLNCSSDERLKRDIAALNSSSTLSKVLELNPVSYHWKTDVASSTLKYGFIAQQIEGIFPELVATDRDSGYKTLSLNGMIPYVVSAIQELAHNVAGMANYFKTKKVQTDELCVGAVCVTQKQFLDMMHNVRPLNSDRVSSSTETIPDALASTSTEGQPPGSEPANEELETAMDLVLPDAQTSSQSEPSQEPTGEE